MDYLTQAHQELAQSEESSLIINFDTAVFRLKLAAIGFGLIVGMSSVASAWKGQMSSRIYFCWKTPNRQLICGDENNRPYRMSAWQWQQWGMEGRPKTVVKKRTLKASNPYKPLWAGGAFLSFTITGKLLRHLQNTHKEIVKPRLK